MRQAIEEAFLAAGTDDRLGGTIATSVLAAAAGATVLRVHDVREMAEALKLASAVLPS